MHLCVHCVSVYVKDLDSKCTLNQWLIIIRGAPAPPPPKKIVFVLGKVFQIFEPIKVWVSEKCSKKFYLLKKGLKKVNAFFWVLKKVLNNSTFKNVGSKNLLKKGAQKKYYSKK